MQIPPHLITDTDFVSKLLDDKHDPSGVAIPAELLAMEIHESVVIKPTSHIVAGRKLPRRPGRSEITVAH